MDAALISDETSGSRRARPKDRPAHKPCKGTTFCFYALFLYVQIKPTKYSNRLGELQRLYVSIQEMVAVF